jgi:hypothetical protein
VVLVDLVVTTDVVLGVLVMRVVLVVANHEPGIVAPVVPDHELGIVALAVLAQLWRAVLLQVVRVARAGPVPALVLVMIGSVASTVVVCLLFVLVFTFVVVFVLVLLALVILLRTCRERLSRRYHAHPEECGGRSGQHEATGGASCGDS